MSSLPPLSEVVSSQGSPDSTLATAVATLFEPSEILFDKLVPELAASLPSSLDTYSSLIGLSVSKISSWDSHSKAAFISAHPRIGEVNNLSHLSQKEQAAKATPPEVLTRLAYLNLLYEVRYPGLRYITFVNGRSRAEIKDEMESKLGTSPDIDSKEVGNIHAENVPPVEIGSHEWLEELDRAIGDVGKIAMSRLKTLGVA